MISRDSPADRTRELDRSRVTAGLFDQSTLVWGCSFSGTSLAIGRPRRVMTISSPAPIHCKRLVYLFRRSRTVALFMSYNFEAQWILSSVSIAFLSLISHEDQSGFAPKVGVISRDDSESNLLPFGILLAPGRQAVQDSSPDIWGEPTQ